MSSPEIKWIGKKLPNGTLIEKHYPDGCIQVKFFSGQNPPLKNLAAWMMSLWDTAYTAYWETPPFDKRAEWTKNAAAVLGRMTSESKAAAARENGKKGGRPRKS